LLPIRLYEQEIKKKRLVIVPTAPRISALEYSAFSSVDNIDPFIREIAALAAQASDFEEANS
jgi:hypothetical protein